MPYVRTVKTKSGPTAVQVVWSSQRGSRKIEHLGMACRSAGAAAKFYTEVLGLPVVSRETIPEMKLEVVKIQV